MQFRGIICAHIFIVVIQFVRCTEIRLHMQKHYYTGWGDCVCDVQGTRRVWVLLLFLLFAGKKKRKRFGDSYNDMIFFLTIYLNPTAAAAIVLTELHLFVYIHTMMTCVR